MCVHSSVCEVDLGLQLWRVLAEFYAVHGTTSALEREKCPSFLAGRLSLACRQATPSFLMLHIIKREGLLHETTW